MSPRVATLALALALASACRPGREDGARGSASATPGPSAAPSAPSARPEPSCRAAEELGAALAPLAADQPGWLSLRGAPLVGEGGEFPPKGSFVEIFGGAISLDGIPVESADAAVQALRDAVERAAAAPGPPLAFLFAVGPARRDVALFGELLERAPRSPGLWLLAARRGKRAIATPAWLERRLDAATGSWAKARVLDQEIAAATAGCAEVGELFVAVGQSPRDAQMPRFKRDLPKAVAACGCEVDATRLADVAVELLAGGARVTAKRVVIAPDRASARRRLRFAALADGEALWRALPEGGEPIAIE